MSFNLKDFFRPSLRGTEKKNEYHAIGSQPRDDDFKSEAIADNDDNASAYIDNAIDAIDADANDADAKWIQSNDELCSMLLSSPTSTSPSNIKQIDNASSEYKEIEDTEEEDDVMTADSFKFLAQEMAIDPNLDKPMGTLFPMTTSSTTSSNQSPITLPLHEVLVNTPYGYESLLRMDQGYPVVAALSDHVNDSDISTIIEKLISSFEEESSMIISKMILSAFLLTSKTLIFWIANTVNKRFFEEGCKKEIDIRGTPTTLCFFDGSPVLEITFSPGPTFPTTEQHQNLIDKLRRFSESPVFFLRPSGFMVVFRSIDDINSQIHLLKTLLGSDNVLATVGMVNPREFQYLRCKTFSRSNVSLSMTAFSLRAQGSSLTSLVQSSACLLSKQPAILAVSTYSYYTAEDYSYWETPASCLESSIEDIYLLLPTSFDKEILVSTGSIELPGGYIIVTSPSQTRSDDPFLFKIDSPSIESLTYNNLLSQGTSFSPFKSLPGTNLDDVTVFSAAPRTPVSTEMSQSIFPLELSESKEVYIFWDTESCRLSSDDEVEIVVANLESKLLDFIQQDFRAMRSCFIGEEYNCVTEKQNYDINKLFKVNLYATKFGVESPMRNEIQKLTELYVHRKKPTMCIIFGNNNDYKSILSTLYLEGFTSIILINGSDAPLKFPCQRALWSEIRTLQQNAVNPIRHQIFDAKPGSISSSKVNVGSYPIISQTPRIATTTIASNDSKYDVVDIPSRNVALHFKKLILWGTQDHGTAAHETGGGSTPRLRGEPFLCSDNDKATIVMLNMDDSSEKYALFVIGASDIRLQRANSLKKMIEMASIPRTHYFQKEWTHGHMTAIINSKMLNDVEQETNATAYFKSTEYGVSAEIISLTLSQTKRLNEFFDQLIPRQSTMTISKINKANLSEQHLADLHYSHAIFVDMKNVHSNMDEVTMHAYGFDPQFQEAVASIIQTTKVASKKLTCDILSDNFGPLDLHRVSPENKNTKKGKGPKTSGSFVFQDREAGMFYTTFENEIRLFVSKQFDVTITETDHHVSENAKIKTSQQSRTPALKIEYTGRSPLDVQHVRNYLEQFNPYFLDRKQVYFPMADANKYKELNQVKSKQDHLLRNIRNRLLSDKNSVVDPLNSDGFVNIRIKPPMHARGIKRMTLPTDVTVTICSPTGKHEHLEQLRAIENIFIGVDSGYLTVCVEMQNTSTIAKELTLRSTRDDFINEYNLIGLRWLDEGSRLSNNIGIAKIWASSWKSMDNALEAIKNGGGVVIDETKSSKSLKSEHIESSLLNVANDKGSIDDRIIVHWPHASCRYVFLAEPLKKDLSELLNSLRSENLTITSPYRDKTDHLACMLLEGNSDNLEYTANEIESYLTNIANQVRSIQIVMSDSQKKALVGYELVKMKEIQGNEGVHFILEPVASDLQSATSIFDLRLHFNDVKKDEFTSRNATHELVSARVLCSKTHQVVELCILPSSSGVGWETICCLLIIDDSTIGLSAVQLGQLNSGHVLVDKDNLTGKMLLRSKIIKNDLESAISRGLNIAEQLSIEGVTIIAPTNLELNLSVAEVRTLTLETIINIIWTKSISNIKRIICVETTREESSKTMDDVETTVLEPAGGNKLALALLHILLKANRQNIQLHCCNVPLPKTMPAESLYKSNRDIESRAKSGPLIIKGLVSSLVEAVKAVKQIVL